MTFKPRSRGPTDPFSTTDKLMQTFRMPRELVSFLRAEAEETGRDLTSYVNRMLEGFRTWFGLPLTVQQVLEADRRALRMQRYEYFLHLLYLRSNEVIRQGPGFDSPLGRESKKK